MSIVIRNKSVETPFTLPGPYQGVLRPGQRAIVDSTYDDFVQACGGAECIQGFVTIEDSSETSPGTHDAGGPPVSWKQACRAASVANVALTNAPAQIDGVTLAVGDRVLLKDQTTQPARGIYIYPGLAGTFTRARDFDLGAEVKAGLAVQVNEGTVNADCVYFLTTNGAIVIDTTSLTFAGMYIALSASAPADVGTTAAAGSSLQGSRSDHVHDLPEAVLRSVAMELTNALAVNSQKVSQLGLCTVDTDAARKGYVDAQIEAQPVKVLARASTVEPLPGYLRVDDVITATAVGALPAQDNITLIGSLTVGQILFLRHGAAGLDNGLWRLLDAGGATAFVLQRVDSMAAGADAAGALIEVQEGTAFGGTLWRCENAVGVGVVNTHGLAFAPVINPSVKLACRLATAAPLGGYVRTGDVILAAAPGAMGNIDGFPMLAGQKMLLLNGAAGVDNGPYVVLDPGGATAFKLVRSHELSAGMSVAGVQIEVSEGAANANTLWTATNPLATAVINTDAPLFRAPEATLRAAAAALTTDLDVNGQMITGLDDPTAADGATPKGYVDTLPAKAVARVATTGVLPGGNPAVYAGGVDPPTLTEDGALAGLNAAGIDGINTLVAGDVILVKNEAADLNNGPYLITNVGDGALQPFVLTRLQGWKTGMNMAGWTVEVSQGTANVGTRWRTSVAAGPAGTRTDIVGTHNPTLLLAASLVAGAPVSTGTANAAGTATGFARGDHVHAVGYDAGRTIFGDGSDGVVPVNDGATVNAARDMFYQDLTLAADAGGGGATFGGANFRIHVSGTLTIGTGSRAHVNGVDAALSVAGVATAAGTLRGGTDGGIGKVGAGASAAGGNIAQALGAIGGAGSEAGASAAGTFTAPAATEGSIHAFPVHTSGMLSGSGGTAPVRGGSGGGGGGSAGGAGDDGGGGGSGGGVLFILARHIVLTGTGTFFALGGEGGDAASGGGVAGGGGGGGGGSIVLVYETLTGTVPTDAVNCIRGAGGAGAGGGAVGADGADGQVFLFPQA